MEQFSLSSRLDGIKEYYFSTKLRQIDEMNETGEKVINLGIGSPDLPPHVSVAETLCEESQKATNHAYQSYKGSPVLRKAAALWYKKWYGVELSADTEILPLIGSKEGIMHICMTYINAGDQVLIPNPGYPTYRSAATLAGAEVREYELKEENNWYPDFDKLESEDLSKVKLMFVNYPQMPTGQLPTTELFERLVAFGRKNHILICHDNPYSFILPNFSEENRPLSLLSVEGAKDVVIELNSLSKSHNMAGWRVGFVCGAAQRIEEILRFKSNMDSGMFLPLQLAAAKALQLPANWYTQLNKIYEVRRQKVFELLDILNCKYQKDQAGLFVWARVPEKYGSGYELSDEILNDYRVFITPGGIFGSAGNHYVRISLCASESILKAAVSRITSAQKKILS